MDEANAPLDTTQQPANPEVAQPTPQVQQPTEVQPGDIQQPTNPA